MATVLNAKDVCPSWQKMKNPSLKTCCTNQVRDAYIHFDVVLCQVLKWRFEIAHKYLITVTLASNHTVSVFFSYDMAGILYIISDRHRILSLYKLNIHICITYRDIKVYYTCMYYYIIRFHDFQYNYNCHFKWLKLLNIVVLESASSGIHHAQSFV